MRDVERLVAEWLRRLRLRHYTLGQFVRATPPRWRRYLEV